jgi:cell volume regulation protein A
MFVVLGLLVFPHQLPAVIGSGLLVSAFLLLVARPVSVFLALFRSRFDVRDKLFISWAGLRGAVPIVLATFPAIAGLPEAQTIFNLVFFIVVTSVLIQGTTLKPLAKRLGVAESPPKAPGLVKTTGDDLLRIVVPSGARVVGRQVVELGLPATALIVLLRRNGEAYVPRGSTVIEPGDELLLASRRHDHDELRRRFK